MGSRVYTVLCFSGHSAQLLSLRVAELFPAIKESTYFIKYLSTLGLTIPKSFS